MRPVPERSGGVGADLKLERTVVPDKKAPCPNLTERKCLTFAGGHLLRKIGLRINRDLFGQKKSVEWLAFECDIARSTLREIIAGRSNFRILTLKNIAEGLGYKSIEEFLRHL